MNIIKLIEENTEAGGYLMPMTKCEISEKLHNRIKSMRHKQFSPMLQKHLVRVILEDGEQHELLVDSIAYAELREWCDNYLAKEGKHVSRV